MPTQLDDGDRAALVRVLEESRHLGFLGPGPVGGHIDHAVRMGAATGDPPEGPVVDLGSGGGVPGLALALLWPSTHLTLLDASVRRSDHLRSSVATLGLEDRIRVVCARAEDAARGPMRHSAVLVVSRSFGSPSVTLECAAPFLTPGGLLVVSEPPPSAGDTTRWPTGGPEILGLVRDEIDVAGFARFRATERCDERYPRRVGVPAKRPLF